MRRSFRDFAIQARVDFRTFKGLIVWWKEKRYRLPDQSMEQVADDIGVSQEQLSWFFRQYAGTSFLQWRKRLRIRDAKKLLSRKNPLPVTKVGEMVGIPDKSNFRNQFEAFTGMTPAQWRDSHR